MRARKHKAPRVETQGAHAEKTITAVQRESDDDSPLPGLIPGGLGKCPSYRWMRFRAGSPYHNPVRSLEPFLRAIVLLVFRFHLTTSLLRNAIQFMVKYIIESSSCPSSRELRAWGKSRVGEVGVYANGPNVPRHYEFIGFGMGRARLHD